MPGTITTDLTLVNATGGDAESLTNWTTTAAWSGAPAVSGDVYLQGANAINARASSATAGTIALYWDHLTTATANQDLTTTGLHVFFWIKCFSMPAMELRVRGGIGVSISSTAGVTAVGTAPWQGITDSKTWFVTGSDDDPNQGWICHVVDPASTADFSTGTPVMSSVDRIGIRAGALQTVGGGSVKSNPVIWDALRYGTGLTVINGTSGAPVTLADIYAADNATAAKWGILGKSGGIYFGAGKIRLGTTGQTAVTVFTDTGQVIVWRDQRVATGFYEINLQGSASFPTTLTLGAISGTLTSGGCTIRGAGLNSQRLVVPTVVSGGTGYTANDILTVTGGTGTIAAQFRVITVASGVITQAQMETAGSYSLPPTGTLSVTGGTGTGATFTATPVGGSVWTLTASAANQTLNLYACAISEMYAAALATTSTIDGCSFQNCGEITASGATIKNCTFQDMRTATPISAVYQIRVSTSTPVLTNNKYTNCATAILWNLAADVNGNIDGSTFTSGGTGHAIELGPNCPTTLTLTNVTFSGYGGTAGSNPTASSGSANAAIYNNSGKAITINVTGGTTPAIQNGAGSTTTVVAGTVGTTITVVDAVTLAVVTSARVLVTAGSAAGSMPYQKTTSITLSGSTATATCTAHGLVSGTKALIKGADQNEYNGVQTITVVDANTFTYTVSGTPATPATGTIVTTGVIIDGVTDASGVITDSRTYASTQPISGRVRHATSGTLYKTGGITGSVSTTAGFATTVQLIPDT